MNGKNTEKTKRPVRPARMIALSVLCAIAVSTFLFLLPCMTRDGKGLSFTEAIFTATSGICVTGLNLIDPVVTLSRYGQVLLLVLIELGGISMVTFASFFIFAFKKRSAFRSMRLAQEYTNIDVFSQVKPLVKTIVLTSLVSQLLGTMLLCVRFIPDFGVKGIWISLFTAASAYCNAGFDLFGVKDGTGALAAYNGDYYVMGVIMLMIIIGGIGFYVLYDIFTYKKTRHLSLHTKAALIAGAILTLFGFVCIFAMEYNNPKTLEPLSLGEKIVAALFQSVTARSAGFASLNIADMGDAAKIIMMLLMFIGAGSGSTGGGVKTTTFFVLVMTVVSAIKGRKETVILKKRVSYSVSTKALAIVFLSAVAVFFTFCVLLWNVPSMSGVDLLFEAVSVFSTAGLTVGVTANAGIPALMVIIASMYVGRIGPMCFVLALGSKKSNEGEIIPEGRIMIG